MIRAETDQRYLVAGLCVSVLMHGAVWVFASGFVRFPGVGERAGEVAAERRVAEPEATPVRLGIDDGKVTSLAWLGFREETPHQGLPSTIDQSGLTPTPGVPKAAPPAALLPAPQSAPVISSSQVREAAQALTDLGARLADAVNAAMKNAPPGAPTAAQAAAESGGGGRSGEAGLASDKEAIATSIESAPTVRLGQVAAAHGLDILTKKPVWSFTTLHTQRPANPTIRVTFGRDGKVVRAEFVSDGRRTYSTGSTEVDEPLLTAVYSWTARGKRLAELTSQDPRGEVTIIIRVLLVG